MAQKRWSIFKDPLLQAQKHILTKKKSGKNARRPTWMKKDLLDKPKHRKKEAYKDRCPGSNTEGLHKQPVIRLGKLKS